jgi:hypothetical protein
MQNTRRKIRGNATPPADFQGSNSHFRELIPAFAEVQAAAEWQRRPLLACGRDGPQKIDGIALA